MTGPLAGIGVAELSGEIATRYCGRLFAQTGRERLARRRSLAGPQPDVCGAGWTRASPVVADARAALDALESARPDRALAIAGQTRQAIAGGRRHPDGAKRRAAAAGDHLVRPARRLWRLARQRPADPGDERASRSDSGRSKVRRRCRRARPADRGRRHRVHPGPGRIRRDEPPRRIEANVFEAALCFTETGAVSAVALWLGGATAGREPLLADLSMQPLSRGRRLGRGDRADPCRSGRRLATLIGAARAGRASQRFATSLQRLATGDEIDAIARRGDRQAPGRLLGRARRSRCASRSPRRRRRSRCPTAALAGPRRFRAASAAAAARGPVAPFRFSFEGERRPRPRGGPAGPLDGVRVADFSMGWAGPLGRAATSPISAPTC